MSSFQKNIGYQTLSQLIITIMPLITAPYLARVLGAENLGVYSYTYANVSYFMLFAMLGITNYGSREIAISYTQGKESVSKTFFSIFYIQFFMSIVMIAAYILYAVITVKDYRIAAFLQVINIVSCLFDVNWFFIGIEKMKIMAVRGVAIKIIAVCSILLFVKDKNDLTIYVLIMTLTTLANNLILWRYLFGELIFIRVPFRNMINHIKPCCILFFPVLASSVYRIMDKTMLGNLSSYEQLGFYYNADKVINIPICLMSGISMVFIPRMTNYLQNNEISNAEFFFSQVIDAFACLSCAVGIGIMSVAQEFVPVFFGNNYAPCILLVIIFSPVFIIKSMSICIRNAYLIPCKKEIIYNAAIVGGVITNLILNLLLIPQLGAKGAVAATFLTELVVCIIQIAGLGKAMVRIVFRKQLVLYFVNAVIMGILVYHAGFACNRIITLIYKICLGIITYTILCLLEWKIIEDKIFIQYRKFIRGLFKRRMKV